MNSENTPIQKTPLPLSKSAFADRFHNPVMAWIILGVSLVITLSAYFISQQLIEKRLHDRFNTRADEISHAIEKRLLVYEHVLWATVAFLYASSEDEDSLESPVNREHWATFVNALHIEQDWPGIQGIGLSIPIAPTEKSIHEITIRAEGFPDYHIKPTGERDAYSAIVFLEPFDWRNKRAFGYDMWSNPMRREAMARARDEGVAATSGVITLVQETKKDAQRGFLTYVPVYKGGRVPTTQAKRKQAFYGWVYAPFRAGNLMSGILGDADTDILFDIYDGSEQSADSHLYGSLSQRPEDQHHIKTTQDEVMLPSVTRTSVFKKATSLKLQGRTWTIVFKTPPDFSLNEKSNVPELVAVIGLIIDTLLFYVIMSMQFVNRRARKMASEMTNQLQAAKTKLEQEVSERTHELHNAYKLMEEKVVKRTQELHDKVQQMEKIDQMTMGREIRIIELKQEVNALATELRKSPPYDKSN